MVRRFATIVSIISAFVCTAASALALSARAEGDKVYVNEMLVLSLHNGTSAQLSRKARFIAAQLNRLGTDSDLSLDSDDGVSRIKLGDKTIVTIDSDEAEAQHMSPGDLGSAWLANIKAALRLPPIKLGKSELKLPVSGKSEVATVGSEVGSCTLENSDPNVVTALRKGGVLFVRAVAIGHATLILKSANTTESLNVDVLPYAANFPQTIEVFVTGDPASQETTKGAVVGALRTRVSSQPRAEVHFETPKVAELPLESSAEYSVSESASSPNAFPAQGNVVVEVRNIPLGRRPETSLWYSNKPEDVTAPGNLFSARLEADEPIRFLYHHLDGMGDPLVFEARILNDSDTPAKVQVISGDSKPDLNPVLAGYNAGDQFLRNWVANSGEIVTIPPRTEIPISVRRAGPKQTVSGLCYLRLLSGGPDDLLVRMDSFAIEAIDEALTAGFNWSKPWHVIEPQKVNDHDTHVRLSSEVFPQPFVQKEIEYRVGGKYGFVQIGQGAIENEDESSELKGSFGVVYTIHVNVVNPTPVAEDVVIDFQSNAGYSGGLFYVDGRLVRTHLLQPKEDVEIDKVHVEPGDSRQITIVTCPLSGGSYPATLAIMCPDTAAFTHPTSK